MNLCFSEVTTVYDRVLCLLSKPVENSQDCFTELLNQILDLSLTGLVCLVAFFILFAGQRMPVSSMCKLRETRSPFFSVLILMSQWCLIKNADDASNLEENLSSDRAF